jgi:hypothetical protein
MTIAVGAPVLTFRQHGMEQVAPAEPYPHEAWVRQ